MVLNVGDKAPDFTAESTNGDHFNLYRELDNGPILLNFYIGDFGINCASYMRKFIESYSRILDLGVRLVAINDDSLDSHRMFKKRLGAPFEYLYDKDKKIATEYGSIVGPGHMVSGFTNREFYFIVEGGTIKFIWKSTTPKVIPNLDEVIEGIRKGL